MKDKLKIIEEKAKIFFDGAKTSHEWEHVLRVHQNVIHIAKHEDVDMFIVEAAAYLHDIARPSMPTEDENSCHAEKGAEMAEEVLKSLDIEQTVIDQIKHCIICHRATRDNHMPESLEAKVLYDADKLDNIGAIGIGRSFMFASELGAKFHDPNVSLENTKPYTEDDTAFRYFLETQSKILGKMMTKEGLRIAKERARYMEDFFERLNKEVNGEL